MAEQNRSYRESRDKVKTLEELAEIVARLKSKGKKIVHAHGVFDLLHPGHIRHFEIARQNGDVLIVTITEDKNVNKGPGRPVFNHRLRAEAVAALECVDFVAVNKWPTAVNTILALKPDIYVKGSDYRDKSGDITGKIYDEENAVKSVGGHIHFTDDITFSSSQILNRHFSVYPEETDKFLRGLKKRFSAEDIISRLKDLKKLNVLVIGDAIIDEYHYCAGMGKPQKADVVAAKYLHDERFAGGSLAVARHVANFCGKVHLVSVTGESPVYRKFILDKLGSNISSKLFCQNGFDVVKRRFLNPSFLTNIFELGLIPEGNISASLSDSVCRYLGKVLKRYDLVIAADFGHGFISPDIIEVLCSRSNFLAVNVQTNSANMGYNLITKYPRADYICIDEPEIRLALRDKLAEPEELVRRLRKKVKCDKVVVTLGHRGALVYSRKEGFGRIPVFSKEIVDRVGAGDAFLSVTSPFVFNDNPMQVAGVVGNAVGALAVLIVGNRTPVEQVPLFKFITTLLK